jgi:hypothetical protein
MRSRFRLLSIALLAIPFFALPAIGYAAGSAGTRQATAPLSDSGPKVTLPGGAIVAAPTLVAGATMKTVGSADASLTPGGGPMGEGHQTPTGPYFFFDSAGGFVIASLGLPAGATIWQVDVYGCRLTAGGQWWAIGDEDTTAGTNVGNSFATPSGTGVIHGTDTFASGLTLAAGHDWQIVLQASSANSGYMGAVIQYTLPTFSFVPITPTRVLDTRNGTGGLSGPFTNHVARTFQVTGGSTGVPAGAKAVTGNLTVTGQTSSGYLFIGPVAMNNPTSSTLNFPAGDDRANAVTVGLSAAGTLSITFVAPSSGPTAHAIFDVTGYYQ